MTANSPTQRQSTEPSLCAVSTGPTPVEELVLGPVAVAFGVVVAGGPTVVGPGPGPVVVVTGPVVGVAPTQPVPPQRTSQPPKAQEKGQLVQLVGGGVAVGYWQDKPVDEQTEFAGQVPHCSVLPQPSGHEPQVLPPQVEAPVVLHVPEQQTPTEQVPQLTLKPQESVASPHVWLPHGLAAGEQVGQPTHFPPALFVSKAGLVGFTQPPVQAAGQVPQGKAGQVGPCGRFPQLNWNWEQVVFGTVQLGATQTLLVHIPAQVPQFSWTGQPAGTPPGGEK